MVSYNLPGSVETNEETQLKQIDLCSLEKLTTGGIIIDVH
jgi:hypothetical protein